MVKEGSSTRTPNRDRAEQKSATRRRILGAALRIFGREGILGATTATIAAEAGVSHGSIFAHFGTQEALVIAAIEEFGETLARRLHELTAAGARTREVLEAQLAAIREREDFYARLVVEAPLLPRAARSALVCIQSDIAFHLSPAIEADAAEGRIVAPSLPLLFNTWLGLVHYYLAGRELFAPGASVIGLRGTELLDHFMSLIENGK
jgi:AcrR family transcriptional regulator